MTATPTTRPTNLDLMKFKFPIPAIVSILHRISGVVLFFGVGYLTYLLSLTLESKESFEWVFSAAQNSFHGCLILAVFTAAIYHFLAGVRHMLLDFHIGVSLKAARASSWSVLVVTAVSAIVMAWAMIV